MTITLKPIAINSKKIEYSILLGDKKTEMRTVISNKIINLEDKFINDSLVSLGWTPPTKIKDII